MQLALEILGGLVVGASLGLLGAGGAILSVPIFALALGHAHGVVVIESLAVTGVVALVSSLRAFSEKRVDTGRAVALAVPALAGAWLGGPIGNALDDRVQAVLFAAIALVAAWRMVAPSPRSKRDDRHLTGEGEPAAEAGGRELILAGLAGFAIGILTSVIGVGGGFLLVPALVLLLRVQMTRAVGTSLVVIASTTAVAIVSNALHSPEAFEQVSWQSVAIVAGGGIAGSRIAARHANRVPEHTLRRIFAGVLLAVAIGVAVAQTGLFRADS